MNAPEFSVSVHDLDAGGKHFRFRISTAWIRTALAGTGAGPTSSDGELDLRLSKSGKDIVIRGKLRAKLRVPCARCLELAEIGIQEDLSELAVPTAPARPNPSHRDDAPEGSDVPDAIPFDGETLILDDLVRDDLLLGIPMIPLCSDSCPGIRPK
jgi:uncharacterized protein